MKLRLLAAAGGVAALAVVPAIPALAAGPNNGSCASSSLPTPSSGDTTQTLPDGGVVFAGGSPTSGGEAGVEGSHGYLEAQGSASGGSVTGYQTESGLNGYLIVGSAPSVCVGVAGQGGVGAP